MALPPGNWFEAFERDGFARLGSLSGSATSTSSALASRAALLQASGGAAELEPLTARLVMQLDRDEALGFDPETGLVGPGPQTLGWKGDAPYRKVQNLELDDAFGRVVRSAGAEAVCRRVYGAGVPVSTFRAMYFAKPPETGGTALPWHQDRWSDLTADPLVTVWTAIDDATVANGAVRVVPGSHRELLNPAHPSGWLSEAQAEELEAEIAAGTKRAVHLEVEAGESVLLHNWLLHCSGRNSTPSPRRAFSVTYMPASTKKVSDPSHEFPVAFP